MSHAQARPRQLPVLLSVVTDVYAERAFRAAPPGGRRGEGPWVALRSDMRRKIWLERALARRQADLHRAADAEVARLLRDEMEDLKMLLAEVNAQIADGALFAMQCDAALPGGRGSPLQRMLTRVARALRIW